MQTPKKSANTSIKLTEKMKRLVEEEADQENRSMVNMIETLIAEALHKRKTQEKFNLRDYR